MFFRLPSSFAALAVVPVTLLALGCDPSSSSTEDPGDSGQGKADRIEPEAQLCDADDQCAAGQACDFAECHVPTCPPDLNCPAVCLGACTDSPAAPLLCSDDADCDAGRICDHTECHSPDCDPDLNCPAVCLGACIEDPEPVPEPEELCLDDADCDAGSCDTTECHVPQCPPGLDCPAVCWGICVENEESVPLCHDDSDCTPDSWCDTTQCHSPECSPELACPAVCLGACVPY